MVIAFSRLLLRFVSSSEFSPDRAYRFLRIAIKSIQNMEAGDISLHPLLFRVPQLGRDLTRL